MGFSSQSAICRRSRPILIAAVACMLMGLPRDSLGQGNSAVNPDVWATESYWTEERFRDAEPWPMPVVRADDAEVRRAARAPDSRPGARSAGAPPSLEAGDALDMQLYEPDEQEEELPTVPQSQESDALSPMAFALAGAAFTNSRVFPPGTVLTYPYRAVGKLFFSDDPDLGECSGAVIERRLVLTAGHCVYDPERDVFFDRFTFVPAFDRGRAPFGRWNWQRLWVTTSWLNGDGRFPNNADFAVIQVADRNVRGRRASVGDVVGLLAWELFATADNHITSLGYPGNLDRGERLQQTLAQVFDVLLPNAFVFGSFHFQGASGGPVAVNFGQRASGQPASPTRIIGVNSFEDLGDFILGASILNDEFLELLAQACARNRRNCSQTMVAVSTLSPQ